MHDSPATVCRGVRKGTLRKHEAVAKYRVSLTTKGHLVQNAIKKLRRRIKELGPGWRWPRKTEGVPPPQASRRNCTRARGLDREIIVGAEVTVQFTRDLGELVIIRRAFGANPGELVAVPVRAVISRPAQAIEQSIVRRRRRQLAGD